MTPVAEHGTSARMASKGLARSVSGSSLASATSGVSLRSRRALFSITRCRRDSLISSATNSCSAGWRSSKWQALPPGAEQASKIRSPGCGAISWATSCAALSCTLATPSPNLGSSATSTGRLSTMPSSETGQDVASMSTSARLCRYSSRVLLSRLTRKVIGGRCRAARAICSAVSPY